MPSMHGKQLKNDSVILNKLSGTGSLILQTGATFQVPLANILTATDIVNKQYVDSLSSGMTPHASVKTSTSVNINLAGATVSPVIGGYTVSTNDRILVRAQSSNSENGIYVYNGSTFDRSIDMDGAPSQEVKVGDYTFVVDGNFKGYGYVIVTSGTWSGVLSPIGTAPIVWSEFTGPVALTWGNGLIDSGANTIDIDLASNSGLTFTSNQLSIDSSIGGSGLDWTLGVLSVNAANGLVVNGDNVEIASSVAGTGLSFSSGVINIKNTTVSAASYGAADSVGTFTVNAQGQLTTAATTLISIPSGQVNNFTASVQALATQTYAGTGLTATGGTLSIANTTVSAASYGAADSVGTFTVNAQGQLTTAATTLISIPSGQVNNFTASVQALAGQVAAGTGINVASSGGYATVSIANTTVSASSYGAADTVATFTVNAQGQLTTAGSSLISIPSGQVNNFTASVQALATQTYAGTGLTATGGTLSIANTTVSAASYGASDTVATFTVNAQGQLTTAGSSLISIPSGQVNNFTASVQALATQTYAGTGLTATGGTLSIANTTVSAASYGAADTVATFTVNAQGQLTTAGSSLISIPSGQVNNFTASVQALATNISVGNGLEEISPNVIGLGGTLSQSTTIDLNNNSLSLDNSSSIYMASGATTTFQLDGTTNIVSLSSGSSNIDLYTTNISISGDSIQIGNTTSSVQISGGVEIVDGNSTGAYYNGDYEANFVNRSLVTKQYVDSVVTSSGLTATNGLTETSPNVVELGGTLTHDTVINGGNYSFDIVSLTSSSITAGAAGLFLSYDDTALVNVGGTVSIETTLNGNGIYISNSLMSVKDVNNKGLVYGGDYTSNFTTYSLVTKQYVDLAASAGTLAGIGLTKSGSIISIANTAVSAASYGAADSVGTFTVNAQGQLTNAATTLISIPSGQVNNFTASVNTLIDTAVGSPVYTQRSISPTATSGNDSSTGITLTSLPIDLVNISVYVNGQMQFLGNGTNTSVDCYFGTAPSSAKSITSITSGDTLYWNGTYIGFDLDTNDKIDIIYNA